MFGAGLALLAFLWLARRREQRAAAARLERHNELLAHQAERLRRTLAGARTRRRRARPSHRNGSATRRGSRRSASSPAASRTTSTTCCGHPRLLRLSSRRRAARTVPRTRSREIGKAAARGAGADAPAARLRPPADARARRLGRERGRRERRVDARAHPGEPRSTSRRCVGEPSCARRGRPRAARAGARQPRAERARRHAGRRDAHHLHRAARARRRLAVEDVELQPGSYVRIAVRDTGCGMDEETTARAFEPFFTTKERGRGTGLGLATVYGIVRQSGGFVSLDSTPGVGTEVAVCLPRTLEPAALPPIPGAARRLRRAASVEQVLLVEDNTAVRTVLARTCGIRAMTCSRRPTGWRVSRRSASTGPDRRGRHRRRDAEPRRLGTRERVAPHRRDHPDRRHVGLLRRGAA